MKIYGMSNLAIVALIMALGACSGGSGSGPSVGNNSGGSNSGGSGNGGSGSSDSQDDGGSPQTAQPVDLIPGSGFLGATSAPGQIGTGPGSDATAISRWDVVPFQTFKADFFVGVVAFHINGIDRVEFSCNGGAWAAAQEMALNPQTSVREYSAKLHAADFPIDGLLELRAIAYPVAGIPRLLPSLFLYSNVSGTLSENEVFVSVSGSDSTGNGSESAPYLTLKKALGVVGDGGTVTIRDAGSYPVTPQSSNVNNSRWITVRAKSTLGPNDVVVSGDGSTLEVRPKVARLRWQGVGFNFSQVTMIYPEGGHHVWLDQSRLFDSQGWTHAMNTFPVRGLDQIAGSYATSSTASDMMYGFCGFSLVRGCGMQKLSGDALSGCYLVINATVEQLSEQPIPSNHTDLLQHFGVWENFIVYGVKGWNIIASQSFFHDHAPLTTITNSAYVNVLADNNSCNPPLSQLFSQNEHVLFLNVSLLGQQFEFRNDAVGQELFTAKNVAFSNCVLSHMTAVTVPSQLPSGVSVQSCHFVSGTAWGSNPTSGNVTFQNGAGGTFSYAGAGAAALKSSGTAISGLNDPNAFESGATLPNRGAYSLGH